MSLNENIPFLYGELNRTTEYLRYTSKTLSIDNSSSVYSIDINPNTLVTLKRVQIDSSIEDDVIKTYGLFAYNPNTQQFDIQLGDTFQVGTTSGSTSNISEVKIGNQIIPAYMNEAGQLVLEYIPVNAIKDIDDSPIYNEDTNEWELHESSLDGNISIKHIIVD